MSKPSIPARAVRLKNFREYLLDYDKPSDTWFDTNFVYSDTGAAVPKDALVIPWGSEVPEEKLRRLEDILGAYASKRGWDGSWVRSLEDDDIAAIFERFLQKYVPERVGSSLDEAFCQKFQTASMPESLNEGHELVLVAGQLDDSSERIINYLADEYGVAINAVFFRFFRDGDNEYLSRAWLTDPGEVDAKVIDKREKGQWNGEFYVSFGHGNSRDWGDAQKYGFISAGGGPWYTRTLSILEPGARIWVNVPAVGYVGVGLVEQPAGPIESFEVSGEDGTTVSLTSLPLNATYYRAEASDAPENAEHLVRVRWLKTVPLAEAFREKGFFGNQNSAAKPRAKSWSHTVERLKQRFGIGD